MKKAISLLLFLMVAITSFAQSIEKPNIILFFVDDMGWRDPSFMGSEYHETPNFDRLAEEGMAFTNAYSSGPNCAPSRAILLSGQYTPRHGKYAVFHSKRGPKNKMRLEPVPDNGLPLDNFTLAEALKEAGYTPAMIGKWHVNGTPSEQGFDLDYAQKSPKNKEFKKDNDPKNIFEYTRRANQFIENHQDQPFFLYLSHNAVHLPIQGRKPMIEYFDKKEDGVYHYQVDYASMVRHTDQSLGMVMDKLRELGLEDNTLVILTSDNGGHQKIEQHPLRGAKGMLYEGGIRVPMVAKWSGVIEEGKISDVPVSNVDFYPTFLEVAGVPTPEDKILDGESLLPLFRQKDDGYFAEERALFWHFPIYLNRGNEESRDTNFRTRPVTVVRKGDWKLLLFHEEWLLDGGWDNVAKNESVELYHLGYDLGESQNLVATKTHIRDQMLEELFEWKKATGARFAQPK